MFGVTFTDIFTERILSCLWRVITKKVREINELNRRLTVIGSESNLVSDKEAVNYLYSMLMWWKERVLMFFVT